MIESVQVPLFVPANRSERFEKAAVSGADAIIIDLEDAVPPSEKISARQSINTEFTDKPVIVRINSERTPWIADDIAAVLSHRPGAVMIPKSECPDSIARIANELGGISVVALIETAQGLSNARQISAVPEVVRLAFGSVDFCADLNCEHRRDLLLPARLELVLASRIACISAPLDGVTLSIKDEGLAGDDAAHARSIGMSGKLCIHPNQVEAIKGAFVPTSTELEWARRVLSASDSAALVDGEMVDAPVKIRARQILEIFDRTSMK